MDDDIAIKVEHISKIFKLPHEKQNSIKGSLVSLVKGGKRSYEKHEVLKDVSFEIKKGEFFGIVGRNGSGKSTLLKLLAGIYTPTRGQIHVNGKLTPFIELGVGFNPELTGRENVFLNGALLGFNRAEMAAMYDDIVAFAELEKFMDQKLKNYSSGMQVRLAFSIAIQAKTDVLVLDEVLAVGDEAFQRKCVAVFEQYQAQKQTIVLVTHDMGVVERFCTRALMIKDGEIVKMGSPRQVAKLYSEANRDAYAEQSRKREESQPEKGIDIQIMDASTGKPKKRFMQNEEVLVGLSWKREGVQNAGVALMKKSGEYIFGPNTYKDKVTIDYSRGRIFYKLKLTVTPGDYYLKAGLFGSTDAEVLEFVDEGPLLMVEANNNNVDWGGIAFLGHEWMEDV